MTETADTVVRSFIDLRAFADAATVPAGDYLTARQALPLAEGAVTIDLVAVEGNGAVTALAGDEFVILIAGALSIRGQDGTISLGTNESAVIPGGIPFRWAAPAGTRLLVMRCTSGPAGTTAPVAIDEAASLAASGAPLAELLVGPTPSCRNFTDYRSANGEFLCGTWDSTPYHRTTMRYRHHELMHLLAGSVTFVDETGRQDVFSAGDVFLVEQGAACSWESRDDVKKVYAIYRPA